VLDDEGVVGDEDGGVDGDDGDDGDDGVDAGLDGEEPEEPELSDPALAAVELLRESVL
jgi:hypothetical protein